MNKKILFGLISVAIVVTITYKNVIYTADQSQLFQDIFTLIKQNKIDAAMQKADDINQKLETIRGNSGETLLHRAAERDNIEFIEIIINKGINPNVQDQNKQTPLMYAIQVHNVPIVKKLLELGADPLIKNVTDKNALDIARVYKERTMPMALPNKEEVINDFDTIITILENQQK